MSIATVTSKGQVTLPKEIRIKLRLEAGDKIDFRVDDETGATMITPLNKHVDDVFGLLSRRKKNKPVSIGEMEAATRDGFRKERS